MASYLNWTTHEMVLACKDGERIVFDRSSYRQTRQRHLPLVTVQLYACGSGFAVGMKGEATGLRRETALCAQTF